MEKQRTKKAQAKLTKLKKGIVKQLSTVKKQSGMNGKQIADKSGQSKQYISVVERGLQTPIIDTLFDIADAMGGKMEIKIWID